MRRPKIRLPIRGQKRSLLGVVLEQSGCFLPLAADPLPVRRSLGEGGSAASACLPAPRNFSGGETSPRQSRAVGFRRHPSGRKSRRGRFGSMFVPRSRACVYKNASGQGKWPNRDPINEFGFNLLIQSQNPFNWDEEKNLYGFVRNNPVELYDADGRAVPIIIGGGVALTTAQAVAATFGLSLAACLASPPCAKAVQDAIAEALRKAWDACFSRRLSTCTVRCQVVQIGNENNVIAWIQATATGPNRAAACAAAERTARNSTAPGTRTKHCFPR